MLLSLEIGDLQVWRHVGSFAAWLAASHRELEVLRTGVGEVTNALPAAPCEVLADDTGFMADDRMKLFLPLRRVTN